MSHPSRLYPLLVLVLLLLSPGASPASPATQLEIASGRAYWRPGGRGQSRRAPSRLQVADGDWIQVDPGAEAALVQSSGGRTPLPAPGTYRLHQGRLQQETRLGWRPLGGTPEDPPPATSADRVVSPPPRAPPSELFATVRPVSGAVWIRATPEAPWVETRGVVSIAPGSEVKAGEYARIEIDAREDYMVRTSPNAALRVDRRRVEVAQGLVAAQVHRGDRPFELHTPEGLARGAHGLVAAEHHPRGSTLYSYQGLWRVENRPGPHDQLSSLYLAPGKHTEVAGPRAKPAPPLRFDTETQLSLFTENWDEDREPPPAPLETGPEDEAARQQIRSDQLRPPEPGPAPEFRARLAREANQEADSERGGRPALEARERQNWLRLRVLSGRSPRLRRHYLRFRKHYADNRQHPLPPGEEDRPVGYTEGASKKVREEQEAWLQARHAQDLRRSEVSLHQHDLERRDMSQLERERFQREAREELFSYQPLKYQTRSMIPVVRARVEAVVAQAQVLETQIRALGGTPGYESQIATWRTQRDALLREADRRKDQLEELIELH